MPNINTERLQKIVDKITNKIGNVVPVVGNMLYKYDDGTCLYGNISELIDKGVNDTVYDKEDSIVIPENVLNFLVEGKFELILTTCPFDVLDNALKSKGVAVEPYYHRWGQTDNTNIVQTTKDKTLVYHLFGGYEQHMPFSQADFLDCLVSYQNEKANSLSSLLSSKQILLLGSALPSWLFLLLWYPLMKKSGIKYLFEKNNDDDSEYQTCLNSLNFKSENAMNEFINMALDKLKPNASQFSDTLDFEYDIFLSYKSEDREFADKIYHHLNNVCGLNVWYMDARKDASNPGEFYNRIASGIEKSRIFMPIIGKNYGFRFAMFLNDPNRPNINPLIEDLGIISETYLALERKSVIMAASGLPFYEIPVWDMDNIDDMNLYFIQNTMDSLSLFQKIIKYSFSEQGKRVKSFMDFKEQDWRGIVQKTK